MPTDQEFMKENEMRQEGPSGADSSLLEGKGAKEASWDHAADDEIIELTDVVEKVEEIKALDPDRVPKTMETFDFNFETSPKSGEPGMEIPSGPQGPPVEDLSRLINGLDEDIEAKGSESGVGAGQLAGISKEDLETIITEVVRNTVERVARETMAEVAERLIQEAIDGLKQSLDSIPE